MALHGSERVDAFLRWVDGIARATDAAHLMFSEGGRPPIAAVTYVDRPWPGWTLGLTYGASLCAPANVELVTVVRSRSPRWAWAIADFVDRHRDQLHELGIDDTIDWRQPIAEDSEMDAFVIAPPISLDPAERIAHLSDDDHVHLLQAVPVHAAELPLARELGSEELVARLGDGLLDPSRPPLPSG